MSCWSDAVELSILPFAVDSCLLDVGELEQLLVVQGLRYIVADEPEPPPIALESCLLVVAEHDLLPIYPKASWIALSAVVMICVCAMGSPTQDGLSSSME